MYVNRRRKQKDILGGPVRDYRHPEMLAFLCVLITNTDGRPTKLRWPQDKIAAVLMPSFLGTHITDDCTQWLKEYVTLNHTCGGSGLGVAFY